MQEPKFVIRSLSRDDEAEWRELWTGYLEYYETVLPEEIYSSTFSRLLSEDSREFSGLVAQLGERIIGLTHYVYHRSCWSVEDVCYLQDLYVEPGHRGKSYGRALIEAVYHAADLAGCPSVYWQTQHFNSVGRRLYDRVGELSPFIVYQRPGTEA